MKRKFRVSGELLKFAAVGGLLIAQWVAFSVHAQDETVPFEEESLEEMNLDSDLKESPAPKKKSSPSISKKKVQTKSEFDADDADFESDDVSFEAFGDDAGQNQAESESADDLQVGGRSDTDSQDPDAIELEPLDDTEPSVVDNFLDIKEDPVAAEQEPEPSTPEPTPAPDAESLPVVRSSRDEPDLALESRLHNIYMTFHSKAIPPQDWQLMVGDRQSDVYSIQSGDNLWNVSKTLFNDGNYWPKIWSLNRKIENPHEINPGDQLRFVMGTEEDAPSFAVTAITSASETQTLPEASPPESDGMINDLGVEIPPPLVESQPVLKNPPSSLPEWRVSNSSGAYDSSGISIQGRPKLSLKSDIYLTAFVEEPNETILGRVVEVEGGVSTAMEFQYIYISAKVDSLREGQKVLLTQTQGKIKATNDWIKEDELGVEVWVQGEATIESKVASKGKEPGEELYRALVQKTISNIVVGSEIRPGALTQIDASVEGPRSQTVAQISGGLGRMNRELHGEQTIVFLTRGADDGLAEGQIVPIRPIEQLRNPGSLIEYSPRTVGYLRIVKTTPRFATGLVVKTWEDVRTGDLTGQGNLLNSASSGSTKSSVELIPGEESEGELDGDFSEEDFTEEDSTEL